MTPDTTHSNSDPCHNAWLVVLPKTPGSILEEVLVMSVAYCTTLVVESVLKNTSVAENVILGDISDMKNDDDSVLEEAADTTAKQLADGWLTWAKTQQPPPSSTLP